MRQIIVSTSFKRALKRLLRQKLDMRERIRERLVLLESDPFMPRLRTHRLKGKLSGAWSCSVEYDCRIVFKFVKTQGLDEDAVFLIDIGSHDDVY
ncbi:MAG: type II toxin-antitoxin system mRNA interferase toxin, RelE/StbE family [Cyanobacteria bacterium J06634_6]